MDQDGRRPTCWRTEVFFPISRSKETAWYSITADWFAKKIVSLPIYNYFLFLMNASVSTLTTKGAKHGTCWMSHTLAKGWDMNSVVEPSVKKQRGRASPLLPLMGRRPHVVVLSGMNDTKCDLERKTRLVGRSRGIHINKYKS